MLLQFNNTRRNVKRLATGALIIISFIALVLVVTAILAAVLRVD
jgi:hypothetical protein